MDFGPSGGAMPSDTVRMIHTQVSDIPSLCYFRDTASMLYHQVEFLCEDEFAYPEFGLHEQLCSCVKHCLKLPGMQNPATIPQKAGEAIALLLSSLYSLTLPMTILKKDGAVVKRWAPDFLSVLAPTCSTYAAALQQPQVQQQLLRQLDSTETAKAHPLNIACELLGLFKVFADIYSPGSDESLSQPEFKAAVAPAAALAVVVLQYLEVPGNSGLLLPGCRWEQYDEAVYRLYAKAMLNVAEAADSISSSILRTAVLSDDPAAAAAAVQDVLTNEDVLQMVAVHLGVQVAVLHNMFDGCPGSSTAGLYDSSSGSGSSSGSDDCDSSSSSSDMKQQQEPEIAPYHAEYLRQLGLRRFTEMDNPLPGFDDISDFILNPPKPLVPKTCTQAVWVLREVLRARFTAFGPLCLHSSSKAAAVPALLPDQLLLPLVLLLLEFAQLVPEVDQLSAALCEADMLIKLYIAMHQLDSDEGVYMTRQLLLPLKTGPLLLLGPAVAAAAAAAAGGRKGATGAKAKLSQQMLQAYSAAVIRLVNAADDSWLLTAFRHKPYACCVALDTAIKAAAWHMEHQRNTSSGSSSSSNAVVHLKGAEVKPSELIFACHQAATMIANAADEAKNTAKLAATSHGSSRSSSSTAGLVSSTALLLHKDHIVDLLTTCCKYSTAAGSNAMTICNAIEVAVDGVITTAFHLFEAWPPTRDSNTVNHQTNPSAAAAADPEGAEIVYICVQLIARGLAAAGAAMTRLLSGQVKLTAAAAQEPLVIRFGAEVLLDEIRQGLRMVNSWLHSVDTGSMSRKAHHIRDAIDSQVDHMGGLLAAAVERCRSLPGYASNTTLAAGKCSDDELAEEQRAIEYASHLPTTASGLLAELKHAVSLELAQQLESLGAAVCVVLPSKMCCNYHGCTNLSLPGEKLVRCSACRSVYYCSKECQTAHWKKWHKAVCCGGPAA